MSARSGTGNDTLLDGLKGCTHQEIAVLTIAVLILVLGVFGNIVTFFKIVLKRKLRKPVQISIACLSVADFCSLCMQFIRIPIAPCSNTPRVVSVQQFVLNVTAVAINSSTMHIILLTAIRYGLIVHPFQMISRLTSSKVIACSCVSWVISIVLGILYGIYNRKYYNHEIEQGTDTIVQLSIGLYVLLVPLTFFLIFWIMELRAMKKSLLPQRTLKSIKSASRMITMILILYAVFMSPYVIADICRYLHHHHDIAIPEHVILRLYTAAQITILMNYAVNPFIYFLYFRIVFRVKAWSCRAQSRLSILRTREYHEKQNTPVRVNQE